MKLVEQETEKLHEERIMNERTVNKNFKKLEQNNCYKKTNVEL